MDLEKPSSKARDRPLWMISFCFSFLLNFGFFAWIGIEMIRIDRFNKSSAAQPAPKEESYIQIFPEMLQKVEAAPKAPEEPKKFARTSDEQKSAETPKSRRFIGERNTQATSDQAPTKDDSRMPSQSGREPLEGEIPETTESRYQDGQLEPQSSPSTSPSEQEKPSDPAPLAKAESPEKKRPEPTSSTEKLLEGPNPVDVEVSSNKTDKKPTPEPVAQEKVEKEKKPNPAKEMPKPKALSDPAFAGNQSKTAIRGSISRTGRSALDVADSPLGRYQAQISRAVELEWQRNCVKHRDFITPGYLTLRFFVSSNGKVKSVQFLGDSLSGEVQKGFTLNSIRNAPIPPMPPAVKKEMNGDSLELIFNFYF